MLDKYANNINISNKILENSINNNKLSHAYLFEIQDNNDEIVFSFIKKILCKGKKTNEENLICKRIDNKNYPSLKIIKPDGMWIKKEQLLELQKDFSKKSLESDYLIYVIYECEKMNNSAANTILKFLEEPEDGIIAILITDNVHEVIDTIVSRCQVINCKSTMYNIDYIYDREQINNVVNFIDDLEKNKINIIAKIDVLWNNILCERENLKSTFELMFLLYFKAMQHKLCVKNVDNKYIEKILNYNSVYTLKEKINIITKIREALKYNVNINMLMDKFIIEFDGVDINDSCNN